jgi:hypothetical protein
LKERKKPSRFCRSLLPKRLNRDEEIADFGATVPGTLNSAVSTELNLRISQTRVQAERLAFEFACFELHVLFAKHAVPVNEIEF